MLTSGADSRWPAVHRCIAGKPTCIIPTSMRQHGQWTKSDVLPPPRTTCPSRPLPPLYRILPGGGPLGEHRPRQDGRRDSRRIDQMQSLAGSRHEQSPLLICTIKSGQDRLPLHHVGCCQQRNVQPHPHQQTAQTFISSRTRDSRAGFSGILFLAGRIGSDRSSRQSALFPPLIPMSLMMTCQPRDAIPHQTGVKPPKGSRPLSSGPWIGTGRACPTSKGRELCTASLVETSQPVVGRCSRR